MKGQLSIFPFQTAIRAKTRKTLMQKDHQTSQLRNLTF